VTSASLSPASEGNPTAVGDCVIASADGSGDYTSTNCTAPLETPATVCSLANACFGRPCLNGGTCHATDCIGGYSCVCNAQYTGAQCETQLR